MSAMTFGAKLLRLREEHKAKQTEVAKAIG